MNKIIRLGWKLYLLFHLHPRPKHILDRDRGFGWATRKTHPVVGRYLGRSTKRFFDESRLNAGTGFTLLELMIVIVILGLLSTIIMPKILNRPEQARRTAAKVEIRTVESVLAQFKIDTGRFPTTSEGLAVLVSDPGIKGYNPDGYLDKTPVDSWGNNYVYICPSVHGKYYDLESYGKDGEDGGTDDNADIESWNLD